MIDVASMTDDELIDLESRARLVRERRAAERDRTADRDRDPTGRGVTVLGLPLGENDAGAGTIREYLVTLLRQVWVEEEGFSGKRPFGNTSWHWDLYPPLIEAGLISGVLDADGEPDQFDRGEAEAAILEAIDSLGAP